MNSKSLSPIIGTLIILGISLVVAGITYTWTSTVTQEQTKSVQEQVDVNKLVQAQSAIGLTLQSASTTGKLIIANNTAQSMTISSIIVDGILVSISPVTIPPGGIASIDANQWLSEGQSISLVTTAGASKTITVTGEALTQFTSTLSFSDPLNNLNYLNAGRTNANIASGEARLSSSLAWLFLGDLNVSNNSSASVNPSVALDSNNNPSIAWFDYAPGNYDIYYRDWNGSDWVTAAGALSGSSFNASNNDANSVDPSLALDANGNPSIAWQDYTAGNWEIYYRDWNGTNWVTASGSLGTIDLNASTNSGNSSDPVLALDSNGNPSIAWYDNTSGNYEIYYRDWNGTNWVTVNGNLFDRDLNVSNTLGSSDYVSLSLDVNGNPSIAWDDDVSGNYEIYYTEWNGVDWVTVKGSGGTALSNYVWVAPQTNTVVKINKATNTAATITAGTNHVGIAVDSTHVWVTNWASNNISKISKANDKNELNIGVGGYPHGIAVDSTHVWVANSNGNTVSKVRKSDNTVETITAGTFGSSPEGIAVDSTHAWVTNKSTGIVAKINKSNNTKIDISVGSQPYGIAVDSTHAWVVNSDSKTVSKINKDTNLVEATIPVGPNPKGIAVDSTYAWVTYGSGVSRINKSTNQVDVNIIVGGLTGISVDSTHVWAVNWGGYSISKINKDTNLVEATIGVGYAPNSFGDATGYAFDFFGFGNTTDFNVSKNSADSGYNSLALDVNGNPRIAWQDNITGNYEILYRAWNGSDWTATTNVSNTSGDSSDQVLALDSNGNPSIAWSDDTPGNDEIYYRDWNGTNWVTANKNLTDSDLNVSKNSGSSRYPSLVLDASGSPSIAWRDATSGNYEVYFRKRGEGFSSGNTVESIEVDSVTARIWKAALTASTVVPAGTGISFYLSNDNGATWNPATPGIEVAFSSTGSQLKWRADLNSISNTITSRIYDISINYTYEA